jgi:hypothetical protein
VSRRPTRAARFPGKTTQKMLRYAFTWFILRI